MCTSTNNLVINDAWLRANRNPAYESSLYERVEKYTDNRSGISRVLSAIKNSFKLFKEVSREETPIATNAAHKLGIANSAISVLRLPSATEDGIQAVSNLGEEDGVSYSRKILTVARDSFDAFTAWTYAVKFFFNVTLWGRLCSCLDMTSDVADLSLSYSDYSSASIHEERTSGEIQKAFTHSKKYYLLRIAKAVCAVASAILALYIAFTGVQLVSAAVLIALSLVTVFLAIRRDFFKKEGEYSVIDFQKEVVVVSKSSWRKFLKL